VPFQGVAMACLKSRGTKWARALPINVSSWVA
jgi:hypothetical protein